MAQNNFDNISAQKSHDIMASEIFNITGFDKRHLLYNKSTNRDMTFSSTKNTTNRNAD